MYSINTTTTTLCHGCRPITMNWFLIACFLSQVRVMEERLQAEWTTHLPDQAEKEQAISKLATQVEEQVSIYKFSYVYNVDVGI